MKMSSLSKIDANLLLQDPGTQDSENIVNLFLGDNSNPIDSSAIIGGSAYSNTLELNNGELICYHLARDYRTITLYNMNNIVTKRIINIMVPVESMNKNYTMTVNIFGTLLLINMILKDGSFLTMKIPTDFLTSINNAPTLGSDWFKLQTPYDFSVRLPHLLHAISAEFLMVFLEDGGLLGLKSISNDHDFEPILFNDNSYLQSLTRLFVRRSNSRNAVGKVISCINFQQKFLIALTESIHLKIWDLSNFDLIQDYDLSQTLEINDFQIRSTGAVGNYLSIFNNYLALYLPVANGTFQLGSLSVSGKGLLEFQLRKTFPSSLSSSSVWFLADMKLITPIDLNHDSSYLNLVVLWKSGTVTKLQILNVLYEDLQEYKWIEASNKSINDLKSEADSISVTPRTTIDYEDVLFKLKSKYAPHIFEAAQNILAENNFVVSANDLDSQNGEYLANMETLLKDLKNKTDEASSLTIFKDEIIVVNCLTKYNHFLYKVNSTLENYFFNIHINSSTDEEMAKYLKLLNGFASRLPRDVFTRLSESFVDTITGKISSNLTISEKFTQIFREVLQGQFDIKDVQILFNELSTIDVVSCLNHLIDNHLTYTTSSNAFVDSISEDNFMKIISIESLNQLITIHDDFILQVLVTFLLLDVNYSVLENQINKLLELHYKQSLFLKLYQQDKLTLVAEIFKQISKYHFGAKLYSYSEWNSFVQRMVSEIYETKITANPYYWKMFYNQVFIKKNKFENKLFLRNIGNEYYLRNNSLFEFLQAILIFYCEEYEESYKFFQLHDNYSSIMEPTYDLPFFLTDMINSEYNDKSIWCSLIKSLSHKDNSLSRYNYYLSCIFSDYGSSPELALRAIKKSIEISMKENIDLDISSLQHHQLLKLLIYFNIFDEVIDVLRLSHKYLNPDERRAYFKDLLYDVTEHEKFFSILLKLCDDNKPGFLPIEDYDIIDTLLVNNMDKSNWHNYKKIYSFRLINGNRREAVEIIYNYLFTYGDEVSFEVKKDCFLIIINILSTFKEISEQWIINGSEVITLQELRDEYIHL
ncbi:hypothetical protein KAFR_0A02240 [Kazachstania africana CBS 2517]|uniref:Uncharacterized protein n=1 Tax=Kazachstania africana (strain ATCC 22294 / BCRC 22015 / CBS 2517 / CECT 1963 / NBRC 1671 / NRRL Y-8276) TaxID=1071382 RepID=H2AMR2_KAZAF|nr:hypothetical protein KAFR_0A02240 [Kazachstania africana CBS 2517]CCF55662.1 hypothetical protein KAFR_0A02240 [Kazachstania africana CBS 2517]